MKKLLQKILLMALFVMPWVTMAQSNDFTCDFESTADTAAWDYDFSEYSSLEWCIGEANSNGGNNGLYISPDGGETNDVWTEDAELYAYRTLTLSAGNYEYSYDWMAYGLTDEEYLRVALVPSTATFPASDDITATSLPANWIAMDGGSQLCDNADWLTQSGTISVPSDGDYKLVFFWRNSYNTIYQPAAIDNISLTLPTCPKPANLVASQVTSNEITLKWDCLSTFSEWEVKYASQTDPTHETVLTVYEDSVVISDLTANTLYDFTVTSVCGIDSSASITLSQRTNCDDITLPYSESFETTQPLEEPLCWTVAGGTVSVRNSYPADPNAHDGDRYLKMESGAVIASSYIATPCNQLEVSFWLRRSYESAGDIAVCFATEFDQIATAQVIATITPTDNYLNMYEVDCSSSDISTGGYLVFKQVNHTSTYSNYALDDIRIIQLSDCRRPLYLTSSDVTFGGATLTWSEVEGASSYEVVYGQVDDPTSLQNQTISDIADTTVDLTELEANRTYYIWVRNLCGSENSPWREGASFTTQIACAQILDFQVVNATSSAIALAWQYNTEVGRPAIKTELCWREAGATTFDTVFTEENYYILQNLSSSTQYEICARTICGEDTSTIFQSNVATLLHGITVDGTGSTTSDVPTNSYYKYSYSQSLYKASELVGVSSIQSIAFNLSSSVEMDRTWDIYLGHTNRSSLSSTQMLPADSLTLVASNYVFSSHHGWCIIPFTTAFTYHSDSNLVVAVVDKTADDHQGLSFYRHNGSSISSRTDYNPVNPTDIGYMSGYSYSPDIAFPIASEPGACDAPVLVATDIQSTSVQLVWNSSNSNNSWQVEYKLDSETEWTILQNPTSDTNMVVSSLTPGSVYLFRVGTHCGEEVLYSDNVTIFTKCAAIEVPYSEDFSSEDLNPCLTVGNVNDNSDPYVTYQSLYLNYTGGYVILPEFISDLSSLQMQFSHRSSYDGQVAVLAGEDKNDINSFVGIDTFTVTANSGDVIELCQFGEYEGAGHYIAIKGLGRYIYLDNIVVDILPDCGIPTNITIADVSSTSATLNWNSSVGNTLNWMILYHVVGDTSQDTLMVPATNYTATLTNLASNTSYEATVYNICASDTVAALQSVVFKTECGEITLPYFVDFENCELESFPDCWYSTDRHMVDDEWNSSESPIVSDSYNNHGNVLEFADNVNFITPRIPVAANTITVNFDAKAEDGSYTGDLAIGITPSASDISQAVYVDTVNIDNENWQNFSVSFESLADDVEGYVIFKNINNQYFPSDWNDDYYWGYIDNITIMVDYGCGEVSDVQVSNVTATSAQVSFTDASAANDYTIGYSTINDVNNIESESGCITTTGNLTELQPNTTYYVWVRINCNGGSGLWTAGPSFKTPCTAISELPYVENFDSYTEGISTSESYPADYPNHTLPNCWSFLNMSDSKSNFPQAYISKMSSSLSYADSAACLMLSSGNDTLYAILPQFETSVSSLQINFTYRHEGISATNGTLTLGVMTDIANPATFTAIREYPQVNVVTPELHNFALDNLDANSNYYIAFRYAIGSYKDYHVGIDNVVVQQAPVCAIPEQVAVTAISSSSISLSWNDVASNYNVQYRSAEAETWTELSNLTTNTVTLDNLTAQTAYQIRVQSDCGTTVSEWSNILNVATVCDLMTIPYSEDFNSYTTDISSDMSAPSTYPNHTLPTCWNFPVLGQPTPRANLSNRTGYYATGNSLYFTSNANQNIYAVLPGLDAPIDSLQIEFYYRNESDWGNQPQLQLGVMTNPNDINTFTALETYSLVTTMTLVEHIFTNDEELDPNTNYYIAFCVGNGNGGCYVSVDDVLVDYVPTCVRPTLNEVTTVTSSTAELSWVSSAANIEVNYKEVDANNWFSVTANTNPYILSGLDASTDYQVRIRAICQEGDTSAWSLIESFTTACGVLNLPFSEDFTTIGNINALHCWNEYSGLLSDVLAGTEELSDGSNWSVTTRYQVSNGGPALQLNIYGSSCEDWLATPSIYLSGATTVEFDAARRDFNYYYDTDDKLMVLLTNNDGTSWTTIHEWVGDSLENIPLYSDSSVHVSIDLAEYVGDTIRLAFYGESTSSGADHMYMIDNISIGAPAIPICNAPTNLAVANISETSADLSWNGSAITYDVEYRVAETTEWTSLTANQTAYSLTGLQSATTYEWRVRGNCGEIQSDWATSTFTTLTPAPVCDVPTNLAVANITETAADLSWNGTTTAYDIEYRVAETTEWTSLTATETSYSLTGLQSSTAYEWRVRGNCGEIQSDWATSTFTTLEENVPVCPIPTNLSVEADYGEAILSWDCEGEVAQWVVRLSDEEETRFDTVTAHPYTLTELFSATEYRVAVKSLCSATNESEWSEELTFTTKTCPAVTNVMATIISTNSAMIIWQCPEASKWEVMYGEEVDLDDDDSEMTTETRYELEDLEPETHYEFYVRSVCGTTAFGEWSSYSFTTESDDDPEGIDGVASDINFTIYPNPTHGSTTISLQGIEGKVTISVVDMNGRTITNETIECGSDCEKRIDVAGLAQGTYFVRILGDNLNSVRKLIVR